MKFPKLLIVGLFFATQSFLLAQVEIISLDIYDYYEVNEIDLPKNCPVAETIVKRTFELQKELLESEYSDEIIELEAPNNYEYRLFINKNGKVEKIGIIRGLGKKLDKIVVKHLSKWDFQPATKDNKKVKYRFNWTFSGSDYYTAAKEMPQPIGGIKGIQSKITYPQKAKENKIQGRVFVRAFINEKGKVDRTEILKGLGYGCDEEAKNAVKNTKFTPAKNEGETIKSQVVVPILFKLK
ncbi:MAG: energy transducer TonB [Ignavibacteria bacterium]|jgi:protein TonB